MIFISVYIGVAYTLGVARGKGEKQKWLAAMLRSWGR